MFFLYLCLFSLPCRKPEFPQQHSLCPFYGNLNTYLVWPKPVRKNLSLCHYIQQMFISVLSVCFQPDNYLIESTGNVFLSVTSLSFLSFAVWRSRTADCLECCLVFFHESTEVENRSVLVQLPILFYAVNKDHYKKVGLTLINIKIPTASCGL